MNVKQLLRELNLTEIVTLDFETYFDKKYSLRNPAMSTTEYIRDPQFKAHLVGIRTTKMRKARWFPFEQLKDVLAQFDWQKTALLAHHTHFEGLILHHHFGIVPAFYLDTLSMGRTQVPGTVAKDLDTLAVYFGLQGKVKKDALTATKGIRDLPPELLNPLGEYCCDDVDDTWGVFTHLLKTYPFEELLLIHYTVNAYANPILEVDKERAEKELRKEIRQKKKLFSNVAQYLELSPKIKNKEEAVAKALGKNDVLIEALEAQGVKVPMKYSPKQKKMVPAFARTDLEFKAFEKHPNKAVRELYEARLAVKSTNAETRAARLLSHSRYGALPIYLNYAKAHTYRWSGGDKMNPQNFQRGSELRRSIRAPHGCKLGVADSSQIEARTIAWLSQQEDLLQIFRDDGDPYSELATTIYGYMVNKDDNPLERFVGKVGILGLGFGMGAEKYQYTLATGAMGPPVEISLSEAAHVVNVYRRKNYKIVQFWKFLERMLSVMYQGGRYEFHPLNETSISNGMASRFAKGNKTASNQKQYAPILVFRGDGKGNGFVDLPNGLTLFYPNMKAQYDPRRDIYTEFSYQSSENGRSKLYGGAFAENITQAVARIIVAEQSLEIARFYRVVLLVHDEVVFLARTAQMKKAFDFAIKQLSIPPKWCSDLPVAAEGGFDVVYSK